MEVGIINGDTFEVLSPSITGSVVVLGQHLLENGGAILLPQAMPAGKGPGPHDTRTTQVKPANSSGGGERQ